MIRARTILSVAAIALLLGDGAFALFLTVTAAPHPAALTIDGTFPDYSGGRLGSNSSNRIALAFEIATMLPWYRGEVQAPSVALTAQPGPGVRLVEPTTLSVKLQRWDAGIRTTLAGDREVLTPAVPGRWTTANTPMRISPNADVAGSSFFLAVTLNLTVTYQDGSSYGIGGWEPNARTTFFDIRTDVAPFGAATLVAGGIGTALMVVPRRRGRRPALRQV
ncbi:MAG TPA: hypothetical protein VNA10_04650 [Thermoplasmata archaeon]|nr:hypothetical protein [Thermoplasmata archaeon]